MYIANDGELLLPFSFLTVLVSARTFIIMLDKPSSAGRSGKGDVHAMQMAPAMT